MCPLPLAPTRRVRVSAFRIERNQVTNARFAAFVGATGYVTVAERPLDPDQYPGALPELLVPGSLVSLSGYWSFFLEDKPERFGYGTARGSTTRGGLKALKQLVRDMEQGRPAGFTVDGPRGPARVAQPGAVWLARATGNPVLPGFTAPKIVWVRENEPEVYARIASFLLPKDYVRFRLTGALVCDVSDASGTSVFDVGRRTWSDDHLVSYARLIHPGDRYKLRSALRRRVALKLGWPTVFSAMKSRTKRPDWMSSSTRFISALVSGVMMRGPVTYSPYSAVFEIE